MDLDYYPKIEGRECDGCGKHSHTLYAVAIHPLDGVVETALCASCIKESED
jgi:hypothetical protein